jgi:hypothetical protein
MENKMSITYDILLEIIQRNLDYWRNDRDSLQESLIYDILCELKKNNKTEQGCYFCNTPYCFYFIDFLHPDGSKISLCPELLKNLMII